MKNTKHTEMNDSSIEQDNQETLSQSKRKILTSIGVTSGVVGASALVPSTWVKPAVNSVILPAHAQMTDVEDPVDEDPVDEDPVDEDPVDEDPDMIAIVVDPKALGVLNAWGTTGMLTRSITMRLGKKPTANVVVSSAEVSNVITQTTTTFTILDWEMEQVVNLVITNSDSTPASMADEEESTVTFTAVGGGYDDAEAELTYTAGYYNDEHVTDVEATAGAVGTGSATVMWTAPKTRAMPAGYRVQTMGGTAPLPAPMTVTGTSATITGLVSSSTAYTFTVTAVYGTADAADDAPTDQATII